MGEKLNYTSEQKMNYLKNRIFSTIMSGEQLTKSDFDDLKRKIPEYAMLKLGIDDISLQYENLGKDFCGAAGNDSIMLGNEVFDFSGKTENYLQDIKKLVKLFNTTTHELSHIIDSRDIQKTNANREMSIANIFGLSAISAKYDKNSIEYNRIMDFRKSFYYSSRSEVFARKSAMIHTKNFLKDLEDYKKENFPETPEIASERKAFFEAIEKCGAGEDVIIPKLSKDAERYTNSNRHQWIMKLYAEDLEEEQEDLLEIMLQNKAQNFDNIKQDFETSLEKFLDPNCLDFKYTEMDILGAAKLMNFKEFYNHELAKKLYDNAIKNENWATALELSNCKDLNISPKEQDRLSAEINKSVETYQKSQQTQNTESQFSME